MQFGLARTVSSGPASRCFPSENGGGQIILRLKDRQIRETMKRHNVKGKAKERGGLNRIAGYSSGHKC